MHSMEMVVFEEPRTATGRTRTLEIATNDLTCVVDRHGSGIACSQTNLIEFTNLIDAKYC